MSERPGILVTHYDCDACGAGGETRSPAVTNRGERAYHRPPDGWVQIPGADVRIYRGQRVAEERLTLVGGLACGDVCAMRILSRHVTDYAAREVTT